MTKRDPVKYENLRELHALMQPVRMELLNALMETSNSELYIKEIAKKIHASPRNVSFHLSKLADLGFVTAEYRPIQTESGKPGKFYTLNPAKLSRVKKLMELEI